MRHEVTVEPYLSTSVYEPHYGPPVTARALDETVRHVRDRTGAEVVSTAQIIAAPGLDCPPGSRLTLPDGRRATAISTAQHTAPGLPVPASTEVNAE
ncbi:hypothetical protein OHT17_11985 [Streptomyces sp. NBC_00371]|uniref:hypothetical protein n=1 Tax=Streptomyces sp. NBC_00371 TaxID=2975729 RepID=UPI002E271401